MSLGVEGVLSTEWGGKEIYGQSSKHGLMTECETIRAEIWVEWWRAILLGLSGETCHFIDSDSDTRCHFN